MKNENTEPDKNNDKLKGFLKKFGVAGFLFFFLKGLVWIGIFAFGIEGCNKLF